MKISITGRHMDVESSLKEHVLGRTDHLTHFFDNLQRAEVVFSPEKGGGFSSELILHAPKGSVLVVHSHGKSANAAFDVGLDKMERQISKLKARFRKEGRKAGRPDKKLKAGAEKADSTEGFGDLWW